MSSIDTRWSCGTLSKHVGIGGGMSDFGDERLRNHFQKALVSTGITAPIGAALVTDFLCVTHEILFKNTGDQGVLLAQVKLAVGASAAKHLANVVSAKHIQATMPEQQCSLSDSFATLCMERGVPSEQGCRLVDAFLKALDEQRFGRDGIESPLFMTYWCIGDEAAYHLGGLYAGDDAGMGSTELEYMDYRLKRFRTLTDRWRMEMAWDDEDQG